MASVMSSPAPLHVLGSVPAALAWLAGRGVRGLASDSRAVVPGDAFIAWPGAAQDGRRFVRQALAAGAAACVVEADGADAFALEGDERIAAMAGLKGAAGPLVSAFLGSPSDRLKVVATTGTNGKSSTAWWTAQALCALGRPCGFVGTLGVGDPPSAGAPARLVPTGLTTPDPVSLQTAFKRFADANYAACAIEASSIGIAEQRLSGTHLDVALFTNFTQDHLDYHRSMAAYWDAKRALFSWPGLAAAVVNLDDAHGATLAQQIAAEVPDLWTYAVQPVAQAVSLPRARLTARGIAYASGGLGFELCEGEQCVPVQTGLIGGYNVSNLLAVIGGLRALGVALPDAAQVCSVLTPVPGRMQRVGSGVSQPEVIVDYAHTPDALEQALRALQPLAAERGGDLWCVFGCGGDRDRGKRPLMGALAQRLAQHAVVTNDNPRHEAPATIIADIVAGMPGTPAPMVIEDRRAAIAHAVSRCGPRDVVLIAGKGHEDYQDVAGVKHPFDDALEARTALSQRGAV